jgi:hypothetical protein
MQANSPAELGRMAEKLKLPTVTSPWSGKRNYPLHN